jgi:two-component system response regulator
VGVAEEREPHPPGAVSEGFDAPGDPRVAAQVEVRIRRRMERAVEEQEPAVDHRVEREARQERAALRRDARPRPEHRAARVVAEPVRDGPEALDYLFCQGAFADRDARAVPQVVLLDLNLPKLGGLEVLRRLRADERTRLLPVVVLTSSSEDRDLIEGYALGVNSYVVKPVDFTRFAEAVRHVGLYWLVVNQRAPS